MGSGKWTVLDHASNKFPNLGNLGDMFLLMILGMSIWNNSPSTDVKFISYWWLEIPKHWCHADIIIKLQSHLSWILRSHQHGAWKPQGGLSDPSRSSRSLQHCGLQPEPSAAQHLLVLLVLPPYRIEVWVNSDKGWKFELFSFRIHWLRFSYEHQSIGPIRLKKAWRWNQNLSSDSNTMGLRSKTLWTNSLTDSGVQVQWHLSLVSYGRTWVRAYEQATFPSDDNLYIDVSLGDRACLYTRTWVRAYEPNDRCHWACTLESLVYLAQLQVDYRVMTIGSRTQVRAYKPSDKCHWACTPNAGTSVQAQWQMSLGLHTKIISWLSGIDYRVPNAGTSVQAQWQMSLGLHTKIISWLSGNDYRVPNAGTSVQAQWQMSLGLYIKIISGLSGNDYRVPNAGTSVQAQWQMSLGLYIKIISWLSGNDYRVPNAGTSVQAQWQMSLGLHTKIISWLSGNDYRVPNAGTSVQAQWQMSLGLHIKIISWLSGNDIKIISWLSGSWLSGRERKYERTSPVTNVFGLARRKQLDILIHSISRK